MYNIIFSKQVGGTRSVCQLKQLPPSREDFLRIAHEAMGANLEPYRFVLGCKQIDMKSDDVFEQQAHLFQDNVFVFERLLGGDALPMEVLWDLIVSMADDVLKKGATQKNAECVVCCDDTDCVPLCCSTQACVKCTKSLLINGLTGHIPCVTCRNPIDIGAKFGVPEYAATVSTFMSIKEMLRNVDVQVCTCGALLLNETMYPMQQCGSCKRHFCFFCNHDWDESKGMRAHSRYQCSDSCTLKSRVTFELVELAYGDGSVKVPNRRCCPKCFAPGAYDDKCKYHTCPHCKHSFCFICLLPQKECQRVYASSYAHQCVATR